MKKTKYKFKHEFSKELIGAHTFVSFINFPKIYFDSSFENEKINFYADGGLMRFIVFLKTGKWINKYNFDLSNIAVDVFQFMKKSKSNILIMGGTIEEVNFFKLFLVDKFLIPSNKIDICDGFKGADLFDFNLKEYDFALIGMGAPKQEIFAIKAIENGIKRVYTCGAFISQTSNYNSTTTYPKIFILLNIKWMYRLFNEKGHLNRIVYGLRNIFKSINYVK
jgi:hypothetical protein